MGCCIFKVGNEEIIEIVYKGELDSSKEFFDISLQVENDVKDTNNWRSWENEIDVGDLLSTFISTERKFDASRGSIIDSFAVNLNCK